jgi:hypothetical protein
MTSKGQLRKLIREILAMASPYGVTEKMLKDSVDERVPGKVDLTDLREALEWNHSEEYLRSKKNPDTDEVEYFATPKGMAKSEGE